MTESTCIVLHKHARAKKTTFDHLTVPSSPPPPKVDLNKLKEDPFSGPWRDFRVARATVQARPSALWCLGTDWQDNFDVVASAVEIDGNYIQFASDRLRGNELLGFLAAVHDPSGHFFKHLLPPARDSKDVVLVALRAMGHLITKVNPKYLHDPDVIFASCLTYPALPLAHEGVRQDKDLARNVAQHCKATQIGINLQGFVLDIDFLKEVVTYTVQEGIFICRVWALSGKCVLTSFPLPAKEILNCRKQCLGLHRLLERTPVDFVTTCNDVTATEDDWIAWTHGMSSNTPFGLTLDEVNEVSVVIF